METPLLDVWWSVMITVCCGLMYIYGTWNYDYWKKRGVPFVKPQPFVGNMGDILLSRKSIGDVYTEVYWKLNPYPYGGIFKFRQPTVLIRDPELVKQVLIKDFPSFQRNDIEVDINVDNIFGRNPFVLHGERWKNTRTRITPAFTAAKLKPVFPLVQEVCEQLKNTVENLNSTDGVDVKELCARYTTDVVGSCAYGIDCNALQNSENEFREMGKAIIQPDFWNNIKLIIIFFFPKLCKLLRLGVIPKEVRRFFERVVAETISFRERNKVIRNDFMQLLIDIKNNKDSLTVPEQEELSDVDITAHVITFFTDGFETTSLALSFTLYELALHPDIQEKLRAEVEQVMNKHRGRLTFDGIQEMKYLDMVLSETQRLHPGVYVLVKKCTQPFSLKTPSGGMYQMEVGTPVHIPIYCLQRDPKYFSDPEKFDPERFNEENRRSIPKCAYLPFGEGPRICIGMRFAQMQIKAGVATLVKNFKIRPARCMAKDVVLDPNYIMHFIKGGIWLDFVKREI